MRTTTVLLSIVMVFLLAGCSDDDNGTAPVTAPDTPAGLDFADRGLTSLTLSWDACDRATSYRLYRSAGFYGTYDEVYSGAATEYVDSGLDYGMTYHYQVSAANSGGESARSNIVSWMTLEPAGFIVTGSEQGGFDYTFNYFQIFNDKPQYRTNPIGLNILVPIGGDQEGLWVLNEQIEGINVYYHPTAADYPPATGWRKRVGDTETSIVLTPF